VQGETTIGRAISWALAFAGSTAALSIAFLQFVADHEQRAMLFAIGGLALLVWASAHLLGRQT
jgi:hypothetical protein